MCIFFMKLKEFSKYCLHFLRQRILRSDAYILDVVIHAGENLATHVISSDCLLIALFFPQISTLETIIEVEFFSIKADSRCRQEIL